MKFIDLFAGLGGFHLALSQQGHNCVYASEIEKSLREFYKKNFNIYPDGDITKVKISKIPHHHILCAGFPCQPFSQAGHKRGFKENFEGRGNLFFEICRVLRDKEPKAFFLENVQIISI